MRLATRTGLAAFAAAAIATLAIFAVFRGQFGHVLQDRVDAQLERRAETAPILAAVADRLSQSELGATVEGARVITADGVVAVGDLPTDPLPATTEPGFLTVRADGERWRLLSIEVVDVPQVGDRAMVQLVAPLGDTDSAAVRLRRRSLFVGGLAMVAAGLVGYLFGSVASRPLARLRRDTASLEGAPPSEWRVADAYGSAEVDDVAGALNASLQRLADETRRRDEALASARAFASGATHELRTPLQSSLMNLDIARSPGAPETARTESVQLAHQELQRMASSLLAVRMLADAELADPAWFEPLDLADLVDGVVADETRRAPHAVVDVGAGDPDAAPVRVWRDGAQLAVANVVRNAIVHGRRDGADGAHVTVSVQGATVVVDDDGPGIPPDARERVLRRFERNTSRVPGSGLGLAICHQVAAAHGGGVEIGVSPAGGTRVTVCFAPAGAG
jgi:two-component system sensor histidine kinase PrrB